MADTTTEPVIKFKKRQRQAQSIKRNETPSGSESDSGSSDDEVVRRPGHHRDKKKKAMTTKTGESLTAATYTADRSAAIASRDELVTAPARSVGPTRGVASNVRTTIVIDYSPDVCKDYKKTGFCGFGDTCKFLHSREDYKAGWQLDREWDTVTTANKNLGGTTVAHADRSFKTLAAVGDENDEQPTDDDIPLSCVICGEKYKSPVVLTRCGHYFCQSCALSRYRKDPNYAVCGAATNGIFNSSSNKHLERKLGKQRGQ